jgi:hypothetical protein
VRIRPFLGIENKGLGGADGSESLAGGIEGGCSGDVSLFGSVMVAVRCFFWYLKRYHQRSRRQQAKETPPASAGGVMQIGIKSKP